MDTLIKTIRELYATGDYQLESFLPVLDLETTHRRLLSQFVRGEKYPEYGGPILPADPFYKFRDNPEYIVTLINNIRSDYPKQTIAALAVRYNMAPIHIRKILSGEIGKYQPNKHKELRDRPEGDLSALRAAYLACEQEFRKVISGNRKGRKPKAIENVS